MKNIIKKILLILSFIIMEALLIYTSIKIKSIKFGIYSSLLIIIPWYILMLPNKKEK